MQAQCILLFKSEGCDGITYMIRLKTVQRLPCTSHIKAVHESLLLLLLLMIFDRSNNLDISRPQWESGGGWEEHSAEATRAVVYCYTYKRRTPDLLLLITCFI